MISKEDFFNDLEDIVTDKLFIGSSVDDLQKEISNNKWLISVSSETVSSLRKEDFLTFLTRVINNRESQIKSANVSHGMMFYLWYDCQAVQLRFCLISDFNKNLPFTCDIRIVDNPETIIEEFINSEHHDGISTVQNSDIDVQDEGKSSHYILNVYVKNII